MAIKPCRECDENASVDAKTCPHCGVEWPGGADSQKMWWELRGQLLWVIGLGVVFALLMGWL